MWQDDSVATVIPFLHSGPAVSRSDVLLVERHLEAVPVVELFSVHREAMEMQDETQQTS